MELTLDLQEESTYNKLGMPTINNGERHFSSITFSKELLDSVSDFQTRKTKYLWTLVAFLGAIEMLA